MCSHFTGDVIIADWGFTCDEYARMAMAEVKITPFTRGKKQLEKIDVDWSRELSLLRIHVERVIGALKQKYTILQSVLLISLISDNNEPNSTIDKIVKVCMLWMHLFVSFCCKPIKLFTWVSLTKLRKLLTTRAVPFTLWRASDLQTSKMKPLNGAFLTITTKILPYSSSLQ